MANMVAHVNTVSTHVSDVRREAVGVSAMETVVSDSDTGLRCSALR